MGLVMDLVAGDRREILLALAVDDLASLDDRDRFPAHLALGGALDPTWLDLFSEAARSVLGTDEPSDFLDARTELDGPQSQTERTVERIDPGWISALARIGERQIDAVAGRWIDLLEEDLGELGREEKPWIRTLAGDIVAFARAADSARDVLLAWSL